MDDLRSKFLDEVEEGLEGASGESEFNEEQENKNKRKNKVKASGLTTSQVFIIASLLFFLILIVGFFILLLTGKMVI